MKMLKQKEKAPKLTRRDILDSRPVRNADLKWERAENGEVRITLPLRKTWWAGILSKVFTAPKQRVLGLDEIGTKVWDACDGNRTVEQMIQLLSDDLKMNRREVETSLLHYLKTLGSRGLIGFAVDKK
ncbi:hypothetical protein COY52_02330 [Candidatus Desantisbacteria bacterium CG_4_10_14_0_8_um_filter_48_22]|uniref:PqqD family protein n=1 Tax=Candidatus Desantisbacteria bacterium CG_4_10_14_0_8_um_filter_48_22 TaxID=1974543 RepID=A0A2M7SEI9_9BACT|nr:MAG: hypothetical protein AUJ67_00085 [Candidatus Desantisbacteria bacterium CG1_02_49_89]PIV55227.1 MAG: hypothetical protein COS16_07890 [Candidatus Desantisbacteria bacterium CG02_land_8_20_14_3_00_49_13]PIZ17881.1 MAG: hypothetical protein COY52_02330 [Candidatus Desantisbacteria bacterium CG_4_10_14_0_8_um_filter_48_22]PJB27556.1 MAG: hypothetical protein CO111_04705 [Candidatus Desantisbacteria bacterium CG_4_9_14_3_um_filter_50_7]